MNVFVVGINHKTAQIEIREKFFLRSVEQEYLLSELKSLPFVIGAFVLSTCNRTEIYVHFIEGFEDWESALKKMFVVKRIFYNENLRKNFYVYYKERAVEHLLHVATGLDSLALGEKQILGQLKRAVETAQAKLMLSKGFNILFNVAVRAGKKAQSETDISYGGSSISGVAVKMLEETLGTLRNKSVLILGAGKMSALTADRLREKGSTGIYVMNRDIEKAGKLAGQLSAKAVSFFNLKEVLIEVDACICSTGAPHFVLEQDVVEHVLSRRINKKLVLMDISMPRNIDPQIGKLENVLLYSMDDLNKVVEENMSRRLTAVEEVKRIIAGKQEEFFQKIQKSATVNCERDGKTVAVEAN